MKKLIILILIFFTTNFATFSQCDLGNFQTAFRIPVNAYPYTNAQSITVNAAWVGGAPLQNFTYTCGPDAYAGADPTWWLNNASQSLTLTFSQPVCNFTILVNGTNTTEEFYFSSNNGPIQVSNFCPTNFTAILGGTAVLCNGLPSTGTIITCSNLAGATQYVLTHNGLGSGSRYTLLDCYVGCNIVPVGQIDCNTELEFCAGQSSFVNYNATGTITAPNTFTVQLSDAFGSFASPTNIGSIISTALSGSIPITIPALSPAGTAYRVRVNSSNSFIIGNDNGTNITIHQAPSVIANANPASLCIGDSTVLFGSGANTYSWSGGVTNNVYFTPTTTTIYTVTGTDAFGCSNTSSVNVIVNQLPNIIANANPNPVCEGQNLTLSGSGGVSYIWSGSVSNNVPFIPTSTNTYSVTGTDANGCSATSSITVPVNLLPIVSATSAPGNTICFGEMVTLNGSGASTYSWSAPVINNVAFAPNNTSTYTVTGTDANNCSNTASISINVIPSPTITVVSNPNAAICEGESIIFTANGAQNYIWTGGIINAVPFFPTSTSTYTVTGTDVNGCTNTATQSVLVNPKPIVNLGPDQSICEGDSIILNAFVPGATYSWHNASPNAYFNAKTTGLYWVNVTLGNCSARDSMNLTVNNLPYVDLGPDTSICDGSSLLLDVQCPGCSYLWQDGNTGSTYNIDTKGLYSVTITRSNCKSSDDIFVDKKPLPIVDLGNDTTICKGGKIKLNVSQIGATYLWQDGSTNPIFTINNEGNYWVEITKDGCTGRDEKYVEPSTRCECPVFLPNAFSPNNDGINDNFFLFNADNLVLEFFKVYNRWGQEVFSTTNPEFGWEGNYNGKKSEAGTYFYYVKYTCLNSGNKYELKGDVTLLR